LQVREAIRGGKRVIQSEIKELDQMFRTIFMLIGLRPQFLPNDLESMFLYQFVQEEYSNHTTNEIVLAFRKVAKGELTDGSGKIIELFDYFTPAFFGKVMAAYRSWASEAGNRIADEVYIEQLKALDYQKPPTEIEWRRVVEQDYQFFLSNVDASSTYPEQHYDTLVEDEFIKEDFWQKKVQSVRVNILNDLNKGLAALEISNLEKPDNYKNLHETRATIQKYKQGECEKELKAIAKQKVVLAFFKYNRDLGNKNIYQPQ
jgi:hypothetical protein